MYRVCYVLTLSNLVTNSKLLNLLRKKENLREINFTSSRVNSLSIRRDIQFKNRSRMDVANFRFEIYHFSGVLWIVEVENHGHFSRL